jgi:hypothetical protein
LVINYRGAIMSIWDYLYILAIPLFGWMTFLIIRGNFQRKFNENGERLDLIEKEKEENEKNTI